MLIREMEAYANTGLIYLQDKIFSINMSLISLQRYVLNLLKYNYRIKLYQYVSSQGFGMLSFWQDW